MGLCKEDKMDLSRRVSRGEHNNFVVLVDYVLHRNLAFNNLVEWRVLQLVKSNLWLRQVLLNLTFLWFGSPFSYSKDRAGFAELSKDQICVFIKSL